MPGLNKYNYGPNISVGPCLDQYTITHQDGLGGDIESGHVNVTGRNEVILFPTWLGEKDKTKVFFHLNNVPKTAKEKKELLKAAYDRQFLGPHVVTSNYQKSFPTKQQLTCLKEETGITCEILVLEPGQLLFIDAGRLHIFRKMSYNKLPPTDPFFEKRTTYMHEITPASNALNRWNVSIAWDFLYTGYKKESIRSLAERKWFNSVGAAHNNILSQGCIEVPLMILLTKYGKVPKELRTEGLLKQINVLLSALTPVIYGIIKYHGDKLPITKTTGNGTVLMTTKEPAFRSFQAEVEFVNFRCDGCGFHLSNHFLTCKSCKLYGDYNINICTTCCLLKEEELKALFSSKIHVTSQKKNYDSSEMKCRCLCGTDDVTQSKDIPLQRFHKPHYSTAMLEHYYTEDDYKEVLHPARLKRHDRGCETCNVSCFTCGPDPCTCHCNYELVHVWATESEIRRLFDFNESNCKIRD